MEFNKQFIDVCKKDIRCLWKPFLILFLISFIIINWNKIFWVFDYRVLSAEIGTFFDDPTKEVTVDEILSAVWNKTKIKSNYTEKENSIEIPRINIASPLVFVPNTDTNKSAGNLKKYLDRGVLHYPGSTLPGRKGQVIILGHSAPLGWPRIRYDWVFSNLDKLGKGDKIAIIYNGHEYTYRVSRTVYLEKGEELSDSTLTKQRNMLVLVSCWPPGNDNKRIAVEAIMY